MPKGVALEPCSDEFYEMEQLGVSQLGRCGFVLVAGGLGERLGFSGIKLSLPTENIFHKSYIQLYCQYILAIQAKHAEEGVRLPLAIMLSNDTEQATKALFAENSNFGLSDEQLFFMKQEAVAALSNNDAHLAVLDNAPYRIAMKPHGHGDVHSLMYSTGVAAKWADRGIDWCYFFQDTNALVFMSLPIMLGVSIRNGFDMNSMAVPRKAKQAVGGIVKLCGEKEDGSQKSMTINVEYNQLDPLLRANGFADGDVNDPVSGMSPYPGNINELLFHLPSYFRVLQTTHGVVGEFVNPKYADTERELFKKPTRLECMMQDFPKAAEVNQDRVGFTQAPGWFCYTPVKNGQSAASAFAAAGIPPACPMSGESDLYGMGARILRRMGCNVDEDPQPPTIGGITAPLGPRILFDPSNAITVSDFKNVVSNPSKVSISARSTLYLKGNVHIEQLSLDGSLIIENEDPNVVLTVDTSRSGGIVNEGHGLSVLADHKSVVSDTSRASEIRGMFGYEIVEKAVLKIRISRNEYLPGNYTFDGSNVISS